MAKGKNVVSTKSVKVDTKQADEALVQLNDEIAQIELNEKQNEELIATGNKVRKAKSFGSILKGIQEVRKQRLAKFKEDGKE